MARPPLITNAPNLVTRRPAGELLTLRKHQQLLLYGSGGLLSVAILLTAAAAIWQGMRDYYERRRDLHLTGGDFFFADQLMGVDWAVVYIFTGSDVLAASCAQYVSVILLAVAMLVLLWGLLLRMDQRVFAPALASAEKVYESEALNRTIVGTSPVALCLLDPLNARLILQNKRMREYADRLGAGSCALYVRLLEGARQADEGMSEFPLSIELAGSVYWKVQVTAARARHGERPAWLFVLNDVTVQAELERSLRLSCHDAESARIAAESASHAKSQFVAMISHEIRTPLNGMLGHLELMARVPLEEQQRARLQRVIQSADSLLDIVSDVLDFSRIESGHVEIEPRPFFLRSLIEQVVSLFAPDAHGKGLQLYFGVHPSLAVGYVGDAARIRQVLNNLVSNAVKFTPAGSVTLRVSPGEGQAPTLCFEVVDSGIGLSETQLARVFEPFTQAGAGVARQFGGSGLGLALCRQLAALLGGKVDADSHEGGGSVFRFTVPVADAPTMPDPKAGALAGRRIALLSADAAWREEIPHLLRGWGARCMVAAQPSAFEPGWVDHDAILLIFGEQRPWSERDEADVVARVGRVVRASGNGPLQPAQTGKASRVSCYALGGLLAALRAEVASPAPVIVSKDGVTPRRGTVLLVEDHPVNRELIQQQLETLGFIVDAVEGGDEALALWHTKPYVAIVTDINMPGMNGDALAIALRRQGATLPIFAASAIALASEKQRCLDAGITQWLLKPLSLERLDQALSMHVGLAAAATEQPVPSLRGDAMPHEVRRIFVEAGARDLEALKHALERPNAQDPAQHLHAIKGVLQMIGERDVADLFLALEHCCEAGHELTLDTCAHAMHEMRRLLARYTS